MIYKSLLASASFVDFVTVDDGASVHDTHLRAALSDYDSEFFHAAAPERVARWQAAG